MTQELTERNALSAFLEAHGEERLLEIQKKIDENTRKLIVLSSRIAGVERMAFILLPQESDGLVFVDAIENKPVRSFTSALVWGVIQKMLPENEQELEKLRNFFVRQGWMDEKAVLGCRTVPESIKRIDAFFEEMLAQAKSHIVERAGENAGLLIDAFVALVENQQELLKIEQEITLGYHDIVKQTYEVLETIYENSGMTPEIIEAIERGEPPEVIIEMMQVVQEGDLNG